MIRVTFAPAQNRRILCSWGGTFQFQPPSFFLQVVDFSLGIYEQYAQLFMQLPKQSASWTTYVDVFHSSFWCALLASVVVSAAFFHLVFRWSNFRQKVNSKWTFLHIACINLKRCYTTKRMAIACFLCKKILALLIWSVVQRVPKNTVAFPLDLRKTTRFYRFLSASA